MLFSSRNRLRDELGSIIRPFYGLFVTAVIGPKQIRQRKSGKALVGYSDENLWNGLSKNS